MTKDFRAAQIETNKIIASGSTGTNAKILLYPISASSDLVGTIDNNKFKTGSIGTDVFFYVSGSINSIDSQIPGSSVFGGDLYTSGNIKISGSGLINGNLFISNNLNVTGNLKVNGTQRLAYAGSTALDADTALGVGYNQGIVMRDGGDASWLDVFRRDGSGQFVFGSTDTLWVGGTVIQGPATGTGTVIGLSVGSSIPVAVKGDGKLTLGTSARTTTYLGGALISVATIDTDTTLDASHYMVFVDTTGGIVKLTLPAAATGRPILFQRSTGSNNIIVERAGSDNIRSSAAIVTAITSSDDLRHALMANSTTWYLEY